MQGIPDFTIHGSMDLNSFFRKGYAVTQINKALADFLLRHVVTQSFVEGDGHYASENFGAPLISEWEAPYIVPSENLSAPVILNEFWKQAAASPYFSWFSKTLGAFSQGCPMINKFRRGDGMVWHTDSLDGTIMTNCLYLSDDVFDIADGGYLGVGRGSLSNGVPDTSKLIECFDRILTNHGTLVSINNLDISNLHRVDELLADKQRLTLLFHFGYVETTVTKSRLKDLRGIS
jgi:hypothetical protein